MQTLGHVERVERYVNRPRIEMHRRGSELGWRTDYKSNNKLAGDVAYGQWADLAVKGSLLAVSATLLIEATSPLQKIVFGIATTITGIVALASAFETI